MRHGRFTGATTMPAGASARAYVEALRAAGELVPAGFGPVPAASAEETECVLRWLEAPGVRLVHLEGTWCSPAFGAGSARAQLDGLVTATDSVPGGATATGDRSVPGRTQAPHGPESAGQPHPRWLPAPILATVEG